MIKERKRAQTLTDSILEYYNRGYIHDSKLFKKGIFSLLVETKFYANQNAYESLRSSGYMKDLKNMEIEDKLNQYYLKIEDVSFIEDKFNGNIQSVEASLTEKGFYNEFKEIFFRDYTDSVTFTIQG